MNKIILWYWLVVVWVYTTYIDVKNMYEGNVNVEERSNCNK